MRFEEALEAMREGKKVKRPCLAHEVGITGMEATRQRILIYHKHYGFIPYKADSDDILAEDWEIVDE